MLIPQQQNWPPQAQTMIRIPPMATAAAVAVVPPPPPPPPLPTVAVAAASTTPTHERSGTVTTEHANLIERTREDEMLGTNATMSNVLYCNVNYPDLKQQFPGKRKILS